MALAPGGTGRGVTRLPVMPAYALAHAAPDALDDLAEAERFVLPYFFELWLRPEQIFPAGDWRSLGYLGGRGFGKTFAIAAQINREIERGTIVSLALAAPTLDRVDEVQIATLIATSPPWFKAERHGGTIRWPNGVTAECHSAEAPGRNRGSNYDFVWMTELVDWAHTSRAKCFHNLTTSCRSGAGGGRYVWDTTSEGMNELILTQLELHDEAPDRNPIIRGMMFDNPLLTERYLEAEGRKYPIGSQEAAEEIGGRAFTKAGAALWSMDQIDDHRRPTRPVRPELTLVAVDPALSADATADETGIVVGDRGQDGHSYVHTDESGRYSPGGWARIVVEWCDGTRGNAAGVIVERNHLGDNAAHAISAEAQARGMTLEFIPRSETDKPFPARRPGVIFVREVVAASSKASRASGPAAETGLGRVHHVGKLPELERQLTTYVPGTRKSPNRYDAFSYLVTELAGLEHDAPGKANALAVAQTAKAQEQLHVMLRAAARGRRIF